MSCSLYVILLNTFCDEETLSPALQETTQTGEYTQIAPYQNTASGLLPAGNSVNTKKLSASQLASVQAANNVNAQRLIAADVTKVVGANVQLDSNGQPTEVYMLFWPTAVQD